MKLSERNNRMSVELSYDEVDRIVVYALKEYITINKAELANDNLHVEDEVSCRRVIAACAELLRYHGEYALANSLVGSEQRTIHVD